MPIYEYHCGKCGHDFECLVFGQESPRCSACGSETVDRVLSACGFVSKSGSGQTMSRSAGSSSCGSCTSGSCGSCGH